MFNKISIRYLFLFLFLCSPLVWAKEQASPDLAQAPSTAAEPADTASEKVPIVCHGDKVEFLEAEQRMQATGHVIVIYGDVKMSCDKIDLSLATKQGVAEGNVVVYQKDSVLTGDKAEYNFSTQTGTIYKAGFASQLIYGKGPQAIKEGPSVITMRHSYMTTCELAKPHYRIQSRTVKIFLDDKVVMKNVIVYIADVPTLYLPYYSYSLKEERRPKVTVLPGKDKDWGYFVLTSWRYEFSQYIKGILRLDYRTKKDLASGFENYYETQGFGKGFVKTYYMNERTLESKRLWSEPRITHERERYMIYQRHSWDIDQDTDLRFEFWNASDTDILKDYFYRNEYQRQANPESYLSIIRTKPEYTLSFLGKHRFSKLFTLTEYQPQLKLDVPSLRLGKEDSKFYWQSVNSFDNISRKFAHPSDLDEDTVRFDTYNQISRISKFGFLNITPYIGERETYYTKDKYGEHDWWRGAFYTGVDVETKFYRVFNFSTSKWDLDINNLRHLITPKVGYGYIHTPTVLPEKLFQFDALDAIDRLNRFTFSLENKLQTKRKVQGESADNLAAVDLVRLLITTNYDYRLPEGSRFSDVTFDFEFTPFNWLTIEFDTAYDHRQDRFKTFNLDMYADQEDKWTYGLGYRYAHENHSEATVELSFKPTPLWKLGIYERFMFKGYPYSTKKINALNTQEYRIVRDLHCWTSEILYTVSRDEGESIYLVFRLKAFPEMPLEFGTGYHRPKPGSQNPVR